MFNKRKRVNKLLKHMILRQVRKIGDSVLEAKYGEAFNLLKKSVRTAKYMRETYQILSDDGSNEDIIDL